MRQAVALGHVMLSTLAIYLWLIVMLRFVGRRDLSQLMPVDILLIVLLGSAVETSMVGASTVFRIGLVSATTLLVANKGITILFRRYPALRRAIGGRPILIVHDGKIEKARARRLGLSDQAIMQALHEREQCELKDCRFAVFEPDGEINVVPYARKVHKTELGAARGAKA